jgi:DNA-binding Xre family transcriptional regulator
MSLRNLVENCSLGYANTSKMENGKQDIRLLTLKSIADVLNVDIKDLI